MSDAELEDQEWADCRPTPTVLEFEDGSFVFAAADASSSAPGVLAGELSTGDSIILRTKRGKPLTLASLGMAATAPQALAPVAAAVSAAAPSAAAPAAAAPAVAAPAASEQPWRLPGGLTHTSGQAEPATLPAAAAAKPADAALQAAADAALQAMRAPEPEPEMEMPADDDADDEEHGGGLAGLVSSLHGFLNADPEATLATIGQPVDLDAWNAAIAADGASASIDGDDGDAESEAEEEEEESQSDTEPPPAAPEEPEPAAAAAEPAAARRFVVDVGATEPELTAAQMEVESQLSVLETLHTDGLLSDSVYESQRDKLEAQLLADVVEDNSSTNSNDGVFEVLAVDTAGGAAAAAGGLFAARDLWAQPVAVAGRQPSRTPTAGGGEARGAADAARESRQAALTEAESAAAPESPPPPPLESESESE